MYTPPTSYRRSDCGSTTNAVRGLWSTSVRSGDPEQMSQEERAAMAVWGRSTRAHLGGVARRLGRGDDPAVALPGTASPIGIVGRTGVNLSIR